MCVTLATMSMWLQKDLAVRTADSGDDTVVFAQTKHTVLIEQPPSKYERVFQVAPFTNGEL